VFVVDNASSDASIEQLRTLQREAAALTIIENRSNVGFARANNQVINSTAFDYYALVNPDCIVSHTAIETVLTHMQQDPRLGVASCLIRNSDHSIQKTCRRRFPTPWGALVRTLGLSRWMPRSVWFADFDRGQDPFTTEVECVDAVSGAFMVASAAAISKVGTLDEGYFMHCEDLDWCMRFWKAGYRVGFVPGAEVLHHKGVSSRTSPLRVNWHLHKGMLRFYRKFYRQRYPLPLLWLVYLGVALRFLGTAAESTLRRAFATARRRGACA
jgi:GT2 family glycosyltransferase